MVIRYYIVYYTGKLEEVKWDKYKASFDNPSVTALVAEETDEEEELVLCK